jgi:hypothetical protein
VGAKRVGARLSGLWVKWRRSRQSGMKEDKKGLRVGERGRDEWEFTLALAKVYSCFFARARDY